uniref:Uncharacterized protein n=1 Tax=Globodera pallida TaxID=36090 RepID=A0A183CIA7_GLOPA
MSAQQQQKRALSTPPQPLFIDGRRSATTAADSPLFQQQQQLFAYKQHHQQQQQQFPATIPSFVHLPQQVKSAASSLHKLMDAEQIRHLTPPQPKGSAPHFIQTLVSVVAPEGQNARFEAVVTGVSFL